MSHHQPFLYEINAAEHHVLMNGLCNSEYLLAEKKTVQYQFSSVSYSQI
jgi:hypothetical protein